MGASEAAGHGRDREDPRPASIAHAARALASATGPGDDLCAPFVDAFGVTGAVLSTLGDPLGTQTVCASSGTAARIDEIQIDLGEGPCWAALERRTPVIESDLQRRGGQDWPHALEALRALRIGALYAFPLRVGDLDVGSLDLYELKARRPTPRFVEEVESLASIAARQVVRRALDLLDDPDVEHEDRRYSRREVHQATGMVAAQLRIDVNDAEVVLRAHAFAQGRTVRSVAMEVVERRLVFGAGTDGTI